MYDEQTGIYMGYYLNGNSQPSKVRMISKCTFTKSLDIATTGTA